MLKNIPTNTIFKVSLIYIFIIKLSYSTFFFYKRGMYRARVNFTKVVSLRSYLRAILSVVPISQNILR